VQPVAQQHQLLQIPSEMIHGQLLRLHQPVVDGEHLQPTNHLFKKTYQSIPSLLVKELVGRAPEKEHHNGSKK
jgi:hypothetical protein